MCIYSRICALRLDDQLHQACLYVRVCGACVCRCLHIIRTCLFIVCPSALILACCGLLLPDSIILIKMKLCGPHSTLGFDPNSSTSRVFAHIHPAGGLARYLYCASSVFIILRLPPIRVYIAVLQQLSLFKLVV